MTQYEWLNSKGNPVKFDDILSHLKKCGAKIHVGSDSHLIGGKWLFATALCVYFPQSGGVFFYQKHKFPRNKFKTLYDRLMKETTLSILTAEFIREHIDIEIVIHSDVATCDTESARYCSLVKGYVSSMGYDILTKPNAWASSAVADRVSR